MAESWLIRRWCGASLMISLMLVALTGPRSVLADGREVVERRLLVYLDVARPAEADLEWLPLLPRELMRQAVLVAAREEFALATRDAVLGEFAPGDVPDGLSLEASTRAADGAIQLTLSRKAGEADERVLRSRSRAGASGYVPGNDYPSLVRQAEQWSRQELVAALQDWGLEHIPTRINPAAEVPADVEALLGIFNELAQYDAVRHVHGQIREQGESPALLGALVRGYANLGQLSRYHFTAAEQVFYARSLLYAQRMLERHGESRWAYWHRAYAQAMTGMDWAVLEDLRRADRLDDEQVAPAWVAVLDDYVRHRPEALEGHEERDAASLAAYLRFVLAERTRNLSYMSPIFDRLMALQPLCLRAIDGMADRSGVGNQHVMTTLGPEQHMRAIRQHLRAMPGVPPDAVALLPNFEPEAWPAIPMPALVDRLRQAAEDDLKGEPSWAALASLMEEAHLVQVYRRGLFMKHGWGVPVEEFIDEALVSLEGHRYSPIIEAMRFDVQRQAGQINALMGQVDFGDLPVSATPLFDRQWWGQQPTRTRLRTWAWQRLRSSGDDTSHDAALRLTRLHTSEPARRVWFARQMRHISPHSPLWAAILVRFDWEAVQNDVPQYMASFGNDPYFLRRLAEQQMELGLHDDAEQTLERYLQHAPNRWVHEQLASIHRERGDEDRAREIMERFVEHGDDAGLARARTRAELAMQHLAEGRHAEAVTQAEAAAQSWSALTMHTASYVNEQVGDWDRAELWIRRTTERYDNRRLEWYLWCRRTGRGDLATARRLAEQYVADLEGDLSHDQRARRAVFHLLEGDPAAALEELTRQFDRQQDSYIGLHAVLTAHAVGNHAARDDLLARMPAEWIPAMRGEHQRYFELADLVRRHLAGEAVELDRELFDAAVARLPLTQQVNVFYFAAEVIDLLGDPATAEHYRRQCAADVRTTSHLNQTLALARLHAKGIDPYVGPLPELNRIRWEGSADRLYEQAGQLMREDRADEAEPLLLEYIERTGAMRGLRRMARLHIEQGAFERALPFAERAAAWGDAPSMRHAADAHEALGNYEASEAWVQAIARRAEGNRAEWYLWCLRTGRGDLDAARQMARGLYLDADPPHRVGDWRAPTFYLLEGDVEQARQQFEQAYAAHADPWLGLHLAILYHRAGDSAQRDAVLQRVAAIDNPDRFGQADRAAMVTLAEWFATGLVAGANPMPGFEQVEQLVEGLPLSRQVNVYHFAAELFDLAGEDEAARAAWKRCVTPVYVQTVNQVLAYQAMRARDLNPEDWLDMQVSADGAAN